MTLFYYKAVTPAGETLDGQIVVGKLMKTEIGNRESVIGRASPRRDALVSAAIRGQRLAAPQFRFCFFESRIPNPEYRPQ